MITSAPLVVAVLVAFRGDGVRPIEALPQRADTSHIVRDMKTEGRLSPLDLG